MILLDVRMAGLSGLETARLIRARPATRHIPIIFMTAQASDVEEIALAYASGGVDYVIKPFEPEILRAKVGVFVELHRERGERVRQSHARAEAEAVARTIRTLQVLSDAAINNLELDGLITELTDRSATQLGADGAALLLRDESAGGVEVAATRGLELPLIGGRVVVTGQGSLGEVIASRQAALIDGEQLSHDQLLGEGALNAPDSEWLASLLAIPLVAESSPSDCCCSARRRPVISSTATSS